MSSRSILASLSSGLTALGSLHAYHNASETEKSSDKARHFLTFPDKGQGVTFSFSWNARDNSIAGSAFFGSEAEGIKGRVHDGCSASVATTAMMECAKRICKSESVSTQSIRVKYLHPIMANNATWMECWPDKYDDNLLTIKFEITDFDTERVFVKGSGQYTTETIRPEDVTV